MRFYEALAEPLHARGWLQFSVVEFNGAPIAFHFGFDYFDCVTWYKPSFEVRYAEHSPGLLLTRAAHRGWPAARAPRARFHGAATKVSRDASRAGTRYNVYLGVYHSAIAVTGARDASCATCAARRAACCGDSRSWRTGQSPVRRTPPDVAVSDRAGMSRVRASAC